MLHGDDKKSSGCLVCECRPGVVCDHDCHAINERREDIVAMDILLLALARLEHRETGNTIISDQATRLLIKMADDLVEAE